MFRQFKVKSFIAGFIIATLLTSTIFATPIEKTIKVFTNKYKIYVDGSLVNPKDATGNVVEPINYNGTIYLPLRAIGQAIGKSVTWDGKNNSAYIGKYNSTKPSVYLDSLDYFNFQTSSEYGTNWEYWNTEKDKDSTGQNYSNGIIYSMYDTIYKDNNWQYTEYLINQKYSKLNGKFVLHYDTRNSNYETYLKIYGDDILLYTSPTMTAGTLPIDVSVDTTGVIKLKIQIENYGDNDYTYTYYGFVDAGLYE